MKEYTVEVNPLCSLAFRDTPNLDNSGMDVEVLYFSLANNKWFRMGQFDTIIGVMDFDRKFLDGIGTTDLNNHVLLTLANNIEKNLEE